MRHKTFLLEATGEERVTPTERGGAIHIPLYRRADTDEVGGLHDFPPGAVVRAPWRTDARSQDDGAPVVVKLPDGWLWSPDARANNCTRPEDDTHHCWVRHGEPPELTVDKLGDTCQAGAGSIATPGWHGFLHAGHLEDC